MRYVKQNFALLSGYATALNNCSVQDEEFLLGSVYEILSQFLEPNYCCLFEYGVLRKLGDSSI